MTNTANEPSRATGTAGDSYGGQHADAAGVRGFTATWPLRRAWARQRHRVDDAEVQVVYFLTPARSPTDAGEAARDRVGAVQELKEKAEALRALRRLRQAKTARSDGSFGGEPKTEHDATLASTSGANRRPGPLRGGSPA